MKDLNRKAKNHLTELLQQIHIAESSNFGDCGLLYHLAQSFGLIQILDQAAEKRDQGFRVGPLSVIMAINRLVDPRSKWQVPEWYSDTGLAQLTGIGKEELKYDDLLHTLEYWTEAAIARAEQGIFKQLALRYGVSFSHLFWDSTSCYFAGDECTLARHGYSKEHRPDRPQINVEMALLGGTNGATATFPLLARCYEGNTCDKTRFAETLEVLREQFPDFRPTIIFDRGVGSLATFERVLDLNYHLLTALPENRKWLPYLKRAKDWDGGFYYHRTYYQHKIYPVQIGHHGLNLWVFYSRKKARQEAWERERHAIAPAVKAFEKLRLNWRKLKTRQQVKAKVDALLRRYRASRWLRVQIRGSERKGTLQLCITRRERALAQQAQRDGKFMILTDRRDLTAKEVLHSYRCHDANESAFKIIKGPIKLRPVFHYSESRVRGHVFICVLAFFLRSLLHFLLQRAQILLTPERALRLVRKVRLTKLVVKEQNMEIFRLTEVDAQCQEIFQAVGFSPPSFHYP